MFDVVINGFVEEFAGMHKVSQAGRATISGLRAIGAIGGRAAQRGARQVSAKLTRTVDALKPIKSMAKTPKMSVGVTTPGALKRISA